MYILHYADIIIPVYYTPALKRSCFCKRAEITSSASTRILGAPRASHNLGAPLLLIVSARLLYSQYRFFKVNVYFTLRRYHYSILPYTGPKAIMFLQTRRDYE